MPVAAATAPHGPWKRWLCTHLCGRGILETVAEGVETEKVLVALGGDLAQGFPVSRPLPQDKLFLFLNNCEWIVPSADAA